MLNSSKNIYPHCNALLYQEERGRNNHWQCCDNSKTDILAPDLLLPEAIDALESEDVKEKERYVLFINNLFCETKEVNGRLQRIQRSKDFKDKVVNYNNVLSFTSEHVDNIN